MSTNDSSSPRLQINELWLHYTFQFFKYVYLLLFRTPCKLTPIASFALSQRIEKLMWLKRKRQNIDKHLSRTLEPIKSSNSECQATWTHLCRFTCSQLSQIQKNRKKLQYISWWLNKLYSALKIFAFWIEFGNMVNWMVSNDEHLYNNKPRAPGSWC